MPGLSGTDPAITPARAGILRAGAGRSSWPILDGVRAPLYAVAGVLRAGAARSNYHSPKIFLALNGVHIATARAVAAEKALYDSLTIRDTNGRTPSRASFRARGFTVTNGMDLVITMGSKNNADRLFGGQVLPTTQRYIGTPANREFDVSCIDYTWGLRKIFVTGRWYTTVALIAAELIATYAPGYTLDVQDGFADLDEFTATNEPLDDVLTRLVKRGSATGDWKCDYHRVVRVFVGEDTSGTTPTILNTVYGRTLRDFAVTRDPSNWITRVLGEGGGANASAEVAAGETILPVEDANWYPEAGGTVKSGPQGPLQITYTGRSLGGGGGLVGPGAAPTSAPVAALLTGAGIETGDHTYGITFVTGSGESLVSPLVAITVGVVAAPVSAPAAGSPTIGTGPNAGDHDYAVTFVTASGETTPGPVVAKATTLTPAPSSAPTPGTTTIGAGVDDGAHDYAVAFVTAIGETTPSAISGQVTAGPQTLGAITDPVSGCAAGTTTVGAGPDDGGHDYKVTFSNGAGETTPSPVSGSVTTGPVTIGELANPSTAPSAGAPTAGGSVDAGAHDYVVTFGNAAGNTVPSPASNAMTAVHIDAPVAIGAASFTAISGAGFDASADYRWKYTFIRTAGSEQTTPSPASNTLNTGSGALYHVNVDLTGCDTPPAGCVRYWYRTEGNGSVWKRLDVNEGPGTILQDGVSDTLLGADAPTTNGLFLQTIPVTGIPLGPTGTTNRKLWRRFNATGTYKLVTTIGNNTATTHNDTVANASLGADAPSTNTTGTPTAYNQVPLTGIPIGGSGTTGRKIYRRFNSTGTWKLAFTIANNSATTALDTVANASLGADAPTTNTTATTSAFNVVPLTGIPLGDANVTSRKLYRRSGGLGLKLVTTIGNNTASTYTDTMANASLGAAALTTSTAYLQRIPVTAIPLGGALVTSRKIYRRFNSTGTYKLAHTLADNTTTAWTDTVTNASLGADAPATNTATANQVALTGIPIGAASVTSRKVYRTVAGGAQLKLVTTIANNTASTYTDSLADASLGANVPTSDASGLAQPQGQVLAGSLALIVAGTGAFRAGGGWAVIGNGTQVVRYTGVTANELTGIPASGPGAIVASIGYNSTVTASAQLTGIPSTGTGSIRFTILKGDPVNLWVVVNDVAGQTALAALLTTDEVTHDGIVEDVLQDRRLSFTELTARCVAHLAVKGHLFVGVSYTCKDQNTRAGRKVPINLGAPTNVITDLLIHEVVISKFNPALHPDFTVTAATD